MHDPALSTWQLTSRRRRGVASVLAMMFLVIFGSLAAAMAVVAHGNMRTAASGLQVSRAMSAAETGLVFAGIRLQNETSKFVIDKGIVDGGFAERLWMGTYTALDGMVNAPSGTGPGIVHAVRDAHLADSHSFSATAEDNSFPHVDDQFGTLRVKPIALSAKADGSPNPNGPYFRLRYELLGCDESGYCPPYVRVTSEGVDGSIKRTLQIDFRITKKIEFAILSPNRLLIGKNVLIEGPLGSRYGIMPGELDCAHCHPILIRNDFYYLDSALDTKLDLFHAKVAQYDLDGDGRLRPNHPVEGQGLNGTPFFDYTGDGFVDEFDIFLQHFDSNNDGMVAYNSSLAADAGLGALSVEFNGDPQLVRLIDRAIPDRNGDGVINFTDTQLGYMDGVLDARDLYAKVRGRLAFAVEREAWESYHGGQSYQSFAISGAIRPGIDNPAVRFGVSDAEMLEITTEMFDESHEWFSSQGGMPFGDENSGQVKKNLDENPQAQYFAPGDPDHPYGYEGVPYDSYGPYDYYLRPVYRNMTFENVVIPMGNNGLFENCTFIGVTFVETFPENTDINWNFAGSLEWRDEPPGSDTNWGFYPKFTLMAYVDEDIGYVSDTRPYSNNIRFHDSTFLGSLSGVRPLAYTHWRNKIQMTGETRFYLDPNDHDLINDPHPDSGKWQTILANLSPSDVEEMAKSSILMPGWSFDVGSFTSDASADPTEIPIIKLRGIIVAGLFDIRGAADLHGTLLLTFRPKAGEAPLGYYPDCTGTCLAAFNTQIGYFGSEDGAFEGIGPDHPDFDGFGEIRIRYDPDAKLPDGIPWPLKVEPVTKSYTEGSA